MKTTFIIILTFFYFSGYSQFPLPDSVVTKKLDSLLALKNWRIDKIPFPTYGLSFQSKKIHQIEFDILHTFKKHRKHYHYNNRLGLGLGFNFFKQSDVFYVNPILTLNHYLPFNFKKEIGLYSAMNYWQTNVGKLLDRRVTPEFGISFYGFVLSYGYNIPLTSENPLFTRNRLTIKIIRV